jgi:trigger factor
LDELRAAVHKRLEDELKRYQDEELKERLVSRLLEIHSFTVPPSMVERQTRYLMERYQNQVAGQTDSDSAPPMEEVRKSLEGRATRQVRSTLLVEKIAQRENIQVADKDIQERIDQLARAAGERAKDVREFYGRPETRADLGSQMVFDRTLGYLLEHARVKEVESARSKVDESGEKS